jgi:inner membrane protein
LTAVFKQPPPTQPIYREGHLGLSLIIATAFATVTDGWIALGAGIVIVTVEPLPDLDTALKPVLAGRFNVHIEHRGVTHSLAFAGALGVGVGAIGVIAGSPLVAGAAALCSILGHLAGDVVTPMGIRPLWPLRDEPVTLDLWWAKNESLNACSLLLGFAASATALVLSANFNG